MSKGRWKTTVWMIGVSIFILGGCQMKDKVFKEFEIQVNEEQFYQNPLEINQIGDPFVLKSSDGNYYCYPTSDAGRGYKVWVSQDMVHWEKQAENIYIKERDGWAISDFWAPEVYEWDGMYYMYYTARWKEGNSLRIGVATSESPLGKYTKYENNPILYTQSDWEDISGPGHHSITRSPNGKVWYAMYHTHSIPALGGGDRQVNMDVMGFREDGSIYMNGPTISPQLIPSKMGEAYEIMANTQITKNGEPAEVLKDGEFALYTEGLVKTEVISLVGKDIVEVTFDINQEIQGILLYTGVADDEKLEGVTIKFSNGYGISNLKFPDGVGQPAVAQFEPMEVKWIKIYNGDLESSKGVLSLVSVIPC